MQLLPKWASASLLTALLSSPAAALNLEPYVVVFNAAAEGDAMKLCMRDIEMNLYTVTGVAPIFLANAPAANALPKTTTVLYFGTTANNGWLNNFQLPSGCLEGWESHCVAAFTAGAPGTNGYASVVSTGFDLRGAIFAAYAFTDAVLGYKPLYLFTDTPAQYIGAANVNIDARLSLVFPSPAYKYRGTFVNDEDLSGTHRADPLGRNVMDLAAWDVYFQTTLRMKANLVLVGTNPFPDDTANALAARRGLVISHHHYDYLSQNVFSWPLPSGDWDWATDAGTMSYLWRASIAAQSQFPEVVWSVNLRGLNDVAYPLCGNGRDPKVCGATISAAIGNQTAWIRASPGQANATVILYMWQELLPVLTSGDLVLPPGVYIIFTDAGSGYVRTDPNWAQYAQGVYYHTAMYNGNANQLTEMVPVARVAAQLTNVTKSSKSTTVIINNLSDLKPAPMTTAAVYDLAWNPAPWAGPDFNATARAWYARFAMDYCGLNNASATQYAAMWQAFFNVPYIYNGQADNLLEKLVQNGAGDIASDWQRGNGVQAGTITRVQQLANQVGAAAAQALLQGLNQTAWSLLPAVPAARKGFWFSHVLSNIGTHLAPITAVLRLVVAAQALEAVGGRAPDPSAGISAVQSAIAAFDYLMAVRRVTEGDASAWAGGWNVVNMGAAFPLAGWFLGDQLSDLQSSYGALNTLLVSLQQPLQAPLLPVRAPTWYVFEGYQAALRPNYPLASFNPQWNLATYTRINCRVSDVNGNTCFNGPDGGWFVGGSQASVTLQIMTSQTGDAAHPTTLLAMREARRLGVVTGDVPDPDAYAAAATVELHYTTDGTTPTLSSPVYTPGAPPRLDTLVPNGQQSVTLKGMGWINGVATGQVTTTVWQKR